ncbi:MAG TPA: FAD binding domain-containing protein [Stellaceae bacterium]|nr:FAD binding domain-containing protein [Stellaceae bacterium]
MKPSSFEYQRPDSLAAAMAALAGQEATPMSGGQSLLILLRMRMTEASTLIDVSRLPELSASSLDQGILRIGAGTTHAAIEDGLVPDASCGMMARVAGGIAYRAVRNVGTIGGSLALSDPAADWPVCLLALGASVVVQGESGERRHAMADFLTGTFTTLLEPGELLTRIEMPALPTGSRWGYAKLARKHGAFADSLGAAVLPAGGDPRMVLGATMEHARLLTRSMEALARDPDLGWDVLAPILRDDIAEADPNADAYRLRCHVATLRKALLQARGY